MGVYGDAFAAMSLPVIWAYATLGVPAAGHSPANAVRLGAMFAAGGVLTLALTLILRPLTRLTPERRRTAECFKAVGDYLAGRNAGKTLFAETEVRQTIAGARRLAAQAQGGADASNRNHQRVVVLIEIAERLFSLAAALLEAGASPPAHAQEAFEALYRNLERRRADRPALRRLADALSEPAPGDPAAQDPAGLERRMARELIRALRIVARDDAPPPLSATGAQELDFAAFWSPLRANLDPNSIIARHALRYALALAAAVLVFRLFPAPFGYWTPLTVTVVLKPYAGMTLARAVQRVLGTVFGVLAGIALMAVLPMLALQFVAAMGLFFFMMLTLPFNYSLAIAFLSAGLIPFEHVLNPDLQASVGLDRLTATAIGAAIAIAAGHLLWPTFDRLSAPDRLREPRARSTNWRRPPSRSRRAAAARRRARPSAGPPACAHRTACVGYARPHRIRQRARRFRRDLAGLPRAATFFGHPRRADERRARSGAGACVAGSLPAAILPRARQARGRRAPERRTPLRHRPARPLGGGDVRAKDRTALVSELEMLSEGLRAFSAPARRQNLEAARLRLQTVVTNCFPVAIVTRA